jgi:hypothetical protein
MDNIQNCDSYINIQSSQTYRSYKINSFVTEQRDVRSKIIMCKREDQLNSKELSCLLYYIAPTSFIPISFTGKSGLHETDFLHKINVTLFAVTRHTHVSTCQADIRYFKR